MPGPPATHSTFIPTTADPAGRAATMATVNWKDVRRYSAAFLAEFAQVGRCWGSLSLIVQDGRLRPYIVKCEVRDGSTYQYVRAYKSLPAAVAAYGRQKEKATKRLEKSC